MEAAVVEGRLMKVIGGQACIASSQQRLRHGPSRGPLAPAAAPQREEVLARWEAYGLWCARTCVYSQGRGGIDTRSGVCHLRD